MNLLNHCRYTLNIAAVAALTVPGFSSSHREAPLITETPKLDATDFYIFNSYEAGRSDYVTLAANYLPLQDAYGGPNYFSLDPNALYEIHVDNTGDGVEDLTFQFRFSNTPRNIPLAIGPAGNRKTNAVPVLAVGQISATNNGALNLDQTFTVNLIRGTRRANAGTPLTNAANASATFTKPIDNVGNKTIPDYNGYANSYIYTVNIPGCQLPGKLFVGQRKDPFVVNLGETFDLINISTSPLGPVDANKDSLAYKNVTSLILEVPKQCLVAGTNIIGAWTTASKVTAGTAGSQVSQVSRLGMPLVNEVVIGLKDKDKFNASEPKDDLQFADYVTHPTLPAIIELLYGGAGVKAPTAFPRTDLLAVFVTGVAGLNQTAGIGEMIRLNTGIAAVPVAQQNNLGVIAGDNAGFPNGRRPGDDVVDVALRVVMGKLLPVADAPSGQLPFTDGATINAGMFLPVFPYFNAPLPGSPNSPYVTVTLQAAASVTGPYQNVPAAYDAASSKLVTAKPAPEQGYFRAYSDATVRVTDVKVDNAAGTAKIGLK